MIYDLQKASLMKRFSAFLLDLVILFMCFVGVMLLMSAITNYDGYFEKLEVRTNEIQERYNIFEIEKSSGVLFTDFQYMMEDQKSLLPEAVLVPYTLCTEEMNSDPETIKLYETITNLSLVILSVSLMICFVILEFLIPLFLKNGQTVGKKIFSIAVMRKDGIKLSPQLLFIRTILGKYTIGTMVPVVMLLMLIIGADPIVPLAVIVLMFLIQVILFLTNKTRPLIHDSLASTVVVDFQSQMIFDSVEAKQEYQLRLHKEAVDKAPY